MDKPKKNKMFFVNSEKVAPINQYLELESSI